MNGNELQQWITLAQHDAETARLLSNENGHPEIIVYHMHQAIEKFFKALILKAERTIRRTHHIDVLLAELIGIHPELKELEECVLFIHTYSPRLRYPTGDTMSRSDLKTVSPMFEEIVAAVTSLL